MENIIAQIVNNFKLKESQSLQHFRSWVNQAFLGVFILILLTISFVLGRLSDILEHRPEFTIETVNSIYAKEKQILSGGKNEIRTIVASKGGKKYYYVWCKGVENIKEKNKRYFDTVEAAEASGLTLASSCK